MKYYLSKKKIKFLSFFSLRWKISFFLILLLITQSFTKQSLDLKIKASESISPSIEIIWNKKLPGSGSVYLPNLAYDSKRKQLMVVWQDGRNDPRKNADGYGPAYNDDIFGLLVNADNGNLESQELIIANRGRYQNLEPPRFDNESYAAISYDENSDLYLISWMMIPDSTLAASYENDHTFNQGSCTDIAFRTFDPNQRTFSNPLYDISQIRPNDPEYNYSCQQEPEILTLNNKKTLIVWHSLQNRYQKVNNYNVSKDIYAQIINNENLSMPDPRGIKLVTRDEQNQRIPNNQEFPRYLAKGKDRILLVWSDNRPNNAGIWGQFFDFEGKLLGNNFKIIASPVNCDYDPNCMKQRGYLYRPTAGYLEKYNTFIVVASKKIEDGDNSKNQLTMATIEIDSSGKLSIKNKDISDTLSNFWSYPSIGCKKNQCLLTYKKETKIASRILNNNLEFVSDTFLDNLPNYAYQDHSKVVTDDNFFFVAYDSSLNNQSEIRLAKIKTSEISSEEEKPTLEQPSPQQIAPPKIDFEKHIGIGQCHSASHLNNNYVKWFYPTGEVLWSTLEPSKDNYNFSQLEREISNAKSRGKKIIIQVLVSNPYSSLKPVPSWAVNEGVPLTKSGDPIQFNPVYLKLHEKILKEVARRYDKPEYLDTITAIIMQSGGSYGEMTLEYSYCPGDAIPSGRKADVEDPNNIYLKEMAKIYLGSEALSTEMAKKNGNNWVFDDYYIKSVKKIVDIYANNFRYLPIIILEGYGLSCQERIFKEVSEYALTKYGNKFWLKTNGWGSFAEIGEKGVFSQYKNKTHIIFEIGYPSYWCSSEDGYPAGYDYYSCRWAKRSDAINHNNQSINYAINSGATLVCFQDVFFENPNKYYINMNDLEQRLINNYRTNLSAVPTPDYYNECSCSPSGFCNLSCPVYSINNKIDNYELYEHYSYPFKCSYETRILTNQPPSQQDKNSWCRLILNDQKPTPRMRLKGDANGDSKINQLDYIIYLRANLGSPIYSQYNPDFNGDGKVDSLDLLIWKSSYLNKN